MSTNNGISNGVQPNGEQPGGGSATIVDDRREELLGNHRRLTEKLAQTTDPAQVVVLESCLSELQEELDQLRP